MLKIGNYFREKTVKLNDSYTCSIFADGATEPVEVVQCIGFIPPKILQYETAVYKYGNMAQKFLIPKSDSVREFTIDFFESLDTGYAAADSNATVNVHGHKNNTAFRLGIHSWLTRHGRYGKGFEIVENYDGHTGGAAAADYHIAPDDIDFDKIQIDILNNKLNQVVYTHSFTQCRIAKVVPYEFDYQGESLCKWTVTFTFNEYKRG